MLASEKKENRACKSSQVLTIMTLLHLRGKLAD